MAPLSPPTTAREQLPSAEEIRGRLREFLSNNTTIAILRGQIKKALDLAELPEIMVNEGVVDEEDIIPRVISLTLGSQEYVASNLFEEREMGPDDSKKLEKGQYNLKQRREIARKFLNRYLANNLSQQRIKEDLETYLGYKGPVNVDYDEKGFIKKITIEITLGNPLCLIRGFDPSKAKS